MNNINEIITDDNRYLFQNYGKRFEIAFQNGDGCHLFDSQGKEYIDFFAGIAVSTLGYGKTNLSKALHQQVDQIIHSSNYFLNEQQIQTAKLISEMTFSGKTLFLNSGTEANEAAIKLARRYATNKDPQCFNVISFDHSFHGRTFGSMSATAQEKIYGGFGPIVPGFIHLPYNDLDLFKKAIIENKVCAVITELIQGEGGIRLIEKNFIEEIAKICQENDILLIIDEVQTGIGRTGKLCAYQHFNFTPDIITMAKGLAGGVPIGAIHTTDKLAQTFAPGSHGTTFGGNHLACAAATAVLSTIKEENLLEKVNINSAYFKKRLQEIADKSSIISEIRGIGFHLGVQLTIESGKNIVKKALDQGLIINCTANNVLRLTPPLIIEKNDLDEGLKIFEKIIKEEDE